MCGDGCAVVVCDGEAAFLVDQVADKWGIEDERLRANFVAGHAFCEARDFGGGKGDIPNTQIRCKDVSK